jgi:hypothetical protein
MWQAAVDGDEIKAKRQRSWESTKEDVKLRPDRACSESYSGGDSSPLSMKESCKPSELPKQDYIHVRARRGQATDSHSLAERVRREKIGERMKFLQDLVPGCNKVWKNNNKLCSPTSTWFLLVQKFWSFLV